MHIFQLVDHINRTELKNYKSEDATVFEARLLCGLPEFRLCREKLFFPYFFFPLMFIQKSA